MTTDNLLSDCEATIPVWAPGTWGEVCEYIPLCDIRIVMAPLAGNEKTERNLIDVVYSVKTELPSGDTIEEPRTGESNIVKLIKALGWYPRRVEVGYVDDPLPDWLRPAPDAVAARRRRIG
jgi:hypothetical protein